MEVNPNANSNVGKEVNAEAVELKERFREVCLTMMKIVIMISFIEWGYSIFMIVHCKCFAGGRQIICFCIYLKFLHCLYLMRRFFYDVRNRVINQPLSAINAYVTLLFYQIGLFFYSNLVSNLLTDIMLYFLPFMIIDTVIVVSTFVIMRKFKLRKRIVRKSDRSKDTKLILKKIRYLPLNDDDDAPEATSEQNEDATIERKDIKAE